VIVASDSSPLIALAKIDCFSLLQKLYGQIVISSEVYAEVVVAGAGLAGSVDTQSLNLRGINAGQRFKSTRSKSAE
jgi:predicted nucleic acid-binding protein